MSLFTPSKTTTTVITTDFKHRGRIVTYAPCNPRAENPDVYVVCEKHNEYIPAGNYTLDVYDFRDMIDKAFNNCPGCKDEKEWSKSRFPEGSEL